MLLLGAMCVGFVACDGNEPEMNDNKTPSSTTDYVYDIILMTDNLIGATATLSQNGADKFTDEVTLTITPTEEQMYWATVPKIEVKNAEKGNVTETDGVYTWKLTAFAENATVIISGVANSLNSTLVVDDLIGATATLSSNAKYVLFDDEVTLTITPNYEEFYWWTIPTIEITNAIKGAVVENKGVYIWKLTAFADNTTIKVAGYANRFANRQHDYVDLGLPSGLLWATCNVGANSPEEYGDYFAWGETEPKSSYSISNYSYSSNPKVLPLSADAAHVNWGGDWRMPTKEEFEELIECCSWLWITQNEVNGHKVTGQNGNSIFLPDTDGDMYWSSSLDIYWAHDEEYGPVGAYYLWLCRGYGMLECVESRYRGRPVRAVCKPK